MRALALTFATLFALAPFAAGGHPGFVVTHARLESVFAPTEALTARWDLTFTVRNDGPAGTLVSAVDDYWVIFDLPHTVWVDESPMEAGETRTFHARLGYPFPDTITLPGPSWYCLQTGYDWPPTRCWSIFHGVALPDGVYPEEIPHWQLHGVPMGDTP